MEADYEQYFPWILASSVLYSIGTPAIFGYLLYRFKEHGRKGDKVVDRALGWMYEPFRPGKEWWLIAEMVRILLLTSTIGFVAESDHCWMKILCAQVIALAFLVLFLMQSPYRRSSHRILQTISMVIPIISLSWAAAGGWEKKYYDAEGGKAEASFGAAGLSFDAWAVVALHGLLLLPPALIAVFTVGSSVRVWMETRRMMADRSGELHDVPKRRPVAKRPKKAKKQQGKGKKEKAPGNDDSFSSWSSWSNSSAC